MDLTPFFICLILPHSTAGHHRISSHLPCSHIDFRSSLNYFGVRSITQVLDLTAFDHVCSSLVLSNTTAPCFVVYIGLAFAIYFWLVFLCHTSAYSCCMWAWEMENKYTRWIIHGVVSWSARQTVGTVNCPSGPFSPSHAVVKQTMIAEGSPISRLLLLYSHRQDLSPSIHNSGTSLAAWPVWTISIQEIFNASPIIW